MLTWSNWKKSKTSQILGCDSSGPRKTSMKFSRNVLLLFNKPSLQCAKCGLQWSESWDLLLKCEFAQREQFTHLASADLMHHILKFQQIHANITDSMWKLQKDTFFFLFLFLSFWTLIHLCMISQSRHLMRIQGPHMTL